MLMTHITAFYTSSKETEERTHTSTAIDVSRNVYLFVIQQGHYDSWLKSNKLGTKVVSITASFLTMMMFMCYTTDITAKMTSGPPNVPIRNFDDVIFNGYRVIVTTGYYKRVVGNAESGTAKHEVYKKYIEKQVPMTLKEAMKEVLSEPKTILYNVDTTALHPKDPVDRHLSDQVVVQKMDGADKIVVGFGLQNDSEFLALFNHYLLKGIETGILNRLFKRHHSELFTNEQFGINEPQSLSYSNVIFLYICLGAGVTASLIIAGAELIIFKREIMLLRMCKISKTFNGSYKRIKGYCK